MYDERWKWYKTNLNQLLRDKKCIISWSGGIDSTALIPYVIKKYGCQVYPIFVNRKQRNYKKEKAAIRHYSKEFRRVFGNNFNKCFCVSIISPPSNFRKSFGDKPEIYMLRNSDLVNQAVRYALVKQVNTILVGSLGEDIAWPDNTMSYWGSKIHEIRDGTRNKELIVVPVLAHHDEKLNKSSIIKWCYENDVDLTSTWSCFEGNDKPCEQCEACRIRMEAFKQL